jgi:hypothetical protein
MSPRALATMAAATVLATTGLTAGLTACSGAAADSARSSQSRSVGAATTRARGEDAASAARATVAIPAAANRVLCPAAASPISGSTLPGSRTENIPAGFAVAAVVECVRVPVPGPSSGTRTTEEKLEVAVRGLASLLRALRLPSAPRRSPLPACLVTDGGLPWLALIGRDGQVIHPAVPTGACGMPIEPVLASLNSLRWILLGVTPAGPVIPQTAVSPAPAIGQPSPGQSSTGRPPLQGGPVHRLTPSG